MRQRMMILAAGLVVALASSAMAQAPLQTPVTKTGPVAFAAGRTAPVVVNGSGGCAGSNAGYTSRHCVGIGGGTASPVGCSCFAAEKTFLWGSCRQFFNPQHVCGNGGCGCGLDRFRNHCPRPTYGTGFGAPAANCQGTFTYLNR